MSLLSTARSRPLVSVVGITATVIVAALILYLVGFSPLRGRQPLISACQTALDYLTASTTATRTIATEGPVHRSDRSIVELQYEFRNVFAGQRPGHLVCEFVIATAAPGPQLLRIAVDGQSVDDDLLAEINAVLIRGARANEEPVAR